MALQEAPPVVIRFAGGVETKMDPKQVPTTKLLTLENGVFTRATSIIKRNGYRRCSSKLIDDAKDNAPPFVALGARDSELLAFSLDESFSRKAETDEWSDIGPCFSIIAKETAAVITGTDQSMPDHATNGNVTVHAWEDSRGGVWWSLVSSTGRVLRASEQLDAVGQTPRCVACGAFLHVYWAKPSSTSIMVIVIDPTDPIGEVAPVVLTNDLNAAAPFFDAETTTYAGAPAIVAWPDLGTANLRVSFVHPSGVIGTPSNALPAGATVVGADVSGPVSVTSWREGNASQLGVAFGAGNVSFIGFSLVTTAGIARITATGVPGVVDGAVSPVRITATMYVDTDVSDDPATAIAYEGPNGGVPSQATTHVAWPVGILARTGLRTLRSVGLVSRAFEVNSDGFVTVVHDTTYFNVYLTIRLKDLVVVGRHSVGSGAGLPPRQHVSSWQIDPSTPTQTTLAVAVRERLESELNDKFTETGVNVISLDFANVNSHSSAQLGRGLYIAGACPLHYDGQIITEQGFHVGPELITATPDSSGGSLTPSSTYLYIAWYEWTDGQGEIHRGPTSIGTVVVLGAGQTEVALTLPTLRVTAKSNVRICVARSQPNDETSMNRVTSLDTTTAGQPNGYIANDPTVDTVTFVDQMSDDTALTQEPLYTDGGVLSDDPAELGNFVAGGKMRLFFTSATDPQTIQYSQQIEGGYGVEIPPDLQQLCDPYGGAVNGLAVMDGSVIAFKELALVEWDGDGPTASGDASVQGFTEPSLIPSAAGCADPHSIVLTPAGLFFKSSLGIMLCDRSKSVSYIGAPVEAFNGQRISAATLLPNRTQVAFLTDAGSTLLYDFTLQQWSTFTNHEGLDAVVVDGVYYYLRTDGTVFEETPGVYSDAGVPIVLRFETAWIKMTQWLQGFARFWRALVLGDAYSPHQLKIQVRTDYGAHWSDPMYLDATSASSSAGWITGPRAGAIGVQPLAGTVYGQGAYGAGPYGGTPPDLYQWRVHLGIVGQAIQFRFEDYEQTGEPGQGFSLSELLVVGGVKGNAKRPFSGARST